MSDTGHIRYGSNKSASMSKGNQERRTSRPTPYTNLMPRTTTVYPHSSVMRNEMPESEPLSEFSEGPMSLPMLPAPFRQIKLSPNQVQIQSSPCQLVMRSQRAVQPEIRSTSYNHLASFQFPSVLPQLLLPSPISHCVATNYNPDQSFIMQSTPPPLARGLSASEEKRKSPALNTSPRAKIIKNTGKSPTQGLKLNSVNRRRFFVGTIDQLVRWHKIAKELQLYAIYEVSAILENMFCSHSGGYRMILRNEQKNCVLPLQAVFFPIDRNFPKVKTGELVTCIGRMVGTNKLQVYDMWPTTPESLAGLKRISFLCQRKLQEANDSAPEP